MISTGYFHKTIDKDIFNQVKFIVETPTESSTENDSSKQVADFLSVYNVFLEASELVGDSLDLEDILISLENISLYNKSFLKDCIEKIEKEAVIEKVDS